MYNIRLQFDNGTSERSEGKINEDWEKEIGNYVLGSVCGI